MNPGDVILYEDRPALIVRRAGLVFELARFAPHRIFPGLETFQLHDHKLAGCSFLWRDGQPVGPRSPEVSTKTGV